MHIFNYPLTSGCKNRCVFSLYFFFLFRTLISFYTFFHRRLICSFSRRRYFNLWMFKNNILNMNFIFIEHLKGCDRALWRCLSVLVHNIIIIYIYKRNTTEFIHQIPQIYVYINKYMLFFKRKISYWKI